MINISKERIERIVKSLLLIYMFFLPLHYLFFTILLSSFSFLKIWKELLVMLMVGLSLILLLQKKQDKFRFKFSNPISIFCILFLLYSLICLIFTNYKIPALNVLRVYLIPVILYLITKSINFTKEDFNKGFNILAIEASLISVYAVFQSVFLGTKFLASLGYPVRENGRLATSFYLSGINNFQRASGTFVSSNTFAFFVSIFCIVCFYIIINKKRFNKKTFRIAIITFSLTLIGLFMSFSRSCWIATFIVLTLILINAIQKNSLSISLKSIIRISLVFFVTVLIIVAIISFLSGINIFGIVIQYLINTLSFNDTSAVSHVSSYIDSFNIFIKHIFGTGLGINGPKAAVYFNEYFITESSYFLMLFEFGIIGFVLYFSIYFIAIYKYYRKKVRFDICNYVIIFSLISFLFLPYIQDLEIISYIFIVLGLSVSNITFNTEYNCNILFLHSSSELYGSDKSLYNLSINLCKRNNLINSIHVILPEKGILKDKIENDSNYQIKVSTHNLGVLRRKNLNPQGVLKYIYDYISSVLYLMYYIEKNNINTVYTNTAVVMSGSIAAKMLSINTFWHIRETLDKNSIINRIIIKYITVLSDVIIANSKSTLEHFCNGKEIKRSYVVYNAVEAIPEKSPKYSFDNVDYIIGMAGRINSWKGQELFINAADLLIKKFKNQYNLKFLIAGDVYHGDEPLLKQLNTQINSLNLENHVILLGQENDMAGFYNSLDIFVLPSIKPEPFGLVVIEAMSLGVPVVASNQGGPVEIIDDNTDGILFKSGSPEDLCDKIISLIADKEKYDAISKQAIIKQRSTFSIENYYRKIYEIIIGG